MDSLKKIAAIDPQEYQKVIEFCAKRSSGTEGIPAVIGLDDLTDESRPVFEGAKMDQEMKMEMARDALIFTDLYAKVEDRDKNYPCIALAMSAMAEKTFVKYDGDREPSSYRSLTEKGK